MTQKAMGGGTPSKAPIGYLNTLERDELGRELRSIALDIERAPLVKWAFEAYASGNYSLAGLRTDLVKRGLTTSPTPQRSVQVDRFVLGASHAAEPVLQR